MRDRILTTLLLSISICLALKAQTRQVLQDGTAIINTAEITQDIRGFRGATPVEITIREDTIQSITALPCHETPRFFNRAVNLLKSFIGLSVDEALAKDPDTVSGATMSSKSLIGNVQTGLRHHKDFEEEDSGPKESIVEIRPWDLIRK